MLRLENVTCGYGGVLAVRDVDLSVEEGSAVALVGANGAGKSTILRAASGLLRPIAGRVLLDGRDVTRLPAERRARLGLRHVPEGRQVFGDMTVAENLYVGGTGRRTRMLDDALALFPQLEPHLGRRGGELSGGQQQMVALARALVSRPRYLLVDELSLGLAPVVVDELVASLLTVREQGVALLVVEQHLHVAGAIADVAATVVKGELTAVGPAEEILGDDAQIQATYLGERVHGVAVGDGGRSEDASAIAAAVARALHDGREVPRQPVGAVL